MSNNPNYTGLQTYNIPVSINELISGTAPYPTRTVSQRQNLANARDALPVLMRPPPEHLPRPFLPTVQIERQPTIDLGTAAPRRSYDPDLPTMGDTQMFRKPDELK